MVVQRLSDLAWMIQGMVKVNQASLKLLTEKCTHRINTCSVLEPVVERFSENKGESFVEDVELPDETDLEMPEQRLREDHMPSSTKAQHSVNGFPGTINPRRDFSTDSLHKSKTVLHGGVIKHILSLPSLFHSKHSTFHTCTKHGAITTEELLKISEMAKNRTKKESENIYGTNKISATSKDYSKQRLSERSQERRVPASRIGRMASFGGLAAGLIVGTMSEVAKKSLGVVEIDNKDSGSSFVSASAFMSEANVERIVNTLCRVRGAALKLGQMLSIQDDTIVDPRLLKVFERVRQSADFMPASQMKKVMVQEFGPDWTDKLAHFEDKPFAAASIGQVHKGILHDGREVAIKIQYPGVANSIDSDINNLVMLLKMWNVFPEKMFMDKFIAVARKELALECNYIREADYSQKFKKWLSDDDRFAVPEVIPELSTKQVLTTELISGIPLDQVAALDQETRNHVASSMLNLVLREIFEFKSMQTDPNWSNFFYNPELKKIYLLDFGASRDYPTSFVDNYIEVVHAAAKGDRNTVLEKSEVLGFLTGYETKVMQEAHTDAVMMLGEPFASDEPYDFGAQNTTRRVAKLVPTMLQHRLTPPPEESYSLHRKLSGGFLLAAKLHSKFACKDIFDALYAAYHKRL